MKRCLMLPTVAARLALAGYISLPISSAPAPSDMSTRDGSDIRFFVEGPSDGADAATLVSDFLLVCAAGSRDDYVTACLSLSVTPTCSWQSEMEILIYDMNAAPAVIAGSESGSKVNVTISVLGVANINVSGVLTRVTTLTMMCIFSLVREDG